MNSLAIQGFRGGGIAAQGFPGQIGAPEPATITFVGTYEAGAGSINNIRAGEGFTILPDHVETSRNPFKMVVRANGTGPFDLNYGVSPDNGATYVPSKYQQVASAVNIDGGLAGYTYAAEMVVPITHRFDFYAFNTGTGAINIVFENRLEDTSPLR